MRASGKGFVEVVEFILQRKAELKINGADKKGQTALHFCAAGSGENSDSARVADMLIEAGVELELRDENLQTALMVAVRHAKELLVESLIKAGADLDAKDSHGRDARSYAQEAGMQELLQRCTMAD